VSDEQDDELTQAVTNVRAGTRDTRDGVESTPGDAADLRRREAAQRKVRALENRLRVFALRRAGASFRAIARETGLSVARCHQIVDGELSILTEQLRLSREQLRALELERCDALLLKLDGFLREGRKVEKRVGSDGTVVETTVIMKRPGVGYFFAYMRVLERRAKLLGLDAPTKLELTTPKPERELPDDAIDTRIAELQRAVADADARIEKRQVH
jgi:hypothetical protein